MDAAGHDGQSGAGAQFRPVVADAAWQRPGRKSAGDIDSTKLPDPSRGTIGASAASVCCDFTARITASGGTPRRSA
jgi:hypothetical protein